MTTAIARVTVAITLCLALTACGGGVEDLPGATPDGVSVDTSKDGGITVESEDGSFSGGVGKLPEGFPSDDIPLVKGEVQSGFAMDTTGQKGWSVVITGSAVDHDKAVALLTAKGFSVEGTFGAGGGTMSTQLMSSKWGVLLSTSTAGGQSSTTYTVGPADG